LLRPDFQTAYWLNCGWKVLVDDGSHKHLLFTVCLKEKALRLQGFRYFGFRRRSYGAMADKPRGGPRQGGMGTINQPFISFSEEYGALLLFP
jgi:hypothetical protein